MQTKKPLTLQEFSQKGGQAFKKKYGKKKYSEMGKKGAQTKLEKYGKEYFSKMGKLSALKRRQKKLANNKNILDKTADLFIG